MSSGRAVVLAEPDRATMVRGVVIPSAALFSGHTKSESMFVKVA
jgi:hypothetical protein